MREVIGDRTVDEVLTIGRHDIETSTLKRLADLCSQYGLGIQIQQVQLATVRPPPVVQAAFNEVNQAQQEKQTAINQAGPSITMPYRTRAARRRSARNKPKR